MEQIVVYCPWLWKKLDLIVEPIDKIREHYCPNNKFKIYICRQQSGKTVKKCMHACMCLHTCVLVCACFFFLRVCAEFCRLCEWAPFQEAVKQETWLNCCLRERAAVATGYADHLCKKRKKLPWCYATANHCNINQYRDYGRMFPLKQSIHNDISVAALPMYSWVI